MTAAAPGPGFQAVSELYYVLNRVSRAMNRAVDALAWENDISLVEFNVLLVLGEGEPLSSAQLARRAFVAPQSSHQVVGRMLENGLLEHRPHPTDRRVKLLVLSPTGTEALEKCLAALHDVQERATAGLPDGDAERLTANLQELAETLQGGWFGDQEAELRAAARRPQRAGALARTPDVLPTRKDR